MRERPLGRAAYWLHERSGAVGQRSVDDVRVTGDPTYVEHRDTLRPKNSIERANNNQRCFAHRQRRARRPAQQRELRAMVRSTQSQTTHRRQRRSRIDRPRDSQTSVCATSPCTAGSLRARARNEIYGALLVVVAAFALCESNTHQLVCEPFPNAKPQRRQRKRTNL